jgi:hypothetical protein
MKWAGNPDVFKINLIWARPDRIQVGFADARKGTDHAGLAWRG